MKLAIRPYEKRDYARVLDICVAAFEPIHGPLSRHWGCGSSSCNIRTGKNNTRLRCARYRRGTRDRRVHVIELDGTVAGFIFTVMDAKRTTGEIGLNAVDPKLQGRGVGRAMYEFALNNLKERGAEIACVGTGGDASHAPARRAYEAIGFDKAIPGLHLFKVL